GVRTQSRSAGRALSPCRGKRWRSQRLLGGQRHRHQATIARPRNTSAGNRTSADAITDERVITLNSVRDECYRMTTPVIASVGLSSIGKTELTGRDLFSVALAEAFEGLPDPTDVVEAVYVGNQSELYEHQ